MTPERRLLAALADAELHPAAVLTAQLVLDDEQLALAIGQLRQTGLDIEQHQQQGQQGHHGYRLLAALEPLSDDSILAAMDPNSAALLGQLSIQLQTDSTNSQLRRMLSDGAACGSSCLSEFQSAGRGRRGRQWIAPAGSNLTLSLSWLYPASEDLSGLSLALGVAASDALTDIGITDSQLKWPNDLVWQGRKLGGILIELYPTAAAQLNVIIGVGINLELPQQHDTGIDQPWTDLRRISGQPIARNRLAGRLLHHLLLALQDFGKLDHSHWQQAYQQRDALAGRAVTLTRPDGSRSEGIARGIDASGALLIEQHGRISSHPIGEASVRANTSASRGTATATSINFSTRTAP
jgi:BirA family biotin operon repressor/biotin-[acetyl-CoA-carboxylase] ligase